MVMHIFFYFILPKHLESLVSQVEFSNSGFYTAIAIG
jgi:hypothetical protein